MRIIVFCFLMLPGAARAGDLEITKQLDQLAKHTAYDVYRNYPPAAEVLKPVLDELITFDAPALRANAELQAQWNDVIDLLIAYLDEASPSERHRRAFALDDVVRGVGRPAGIWRDDAAGHLMRAIDADVKAALIALAEGEANQMFPETLDWRARFRAHLEVARTLPVIEGPGGPLFFEIKGFVASAAKERLVTAETWYFMLFAINRWRKQTTPAREYCARRLGPSA